MTNKLQNTRIEFHILQSFPVSCLNRDDVGSPKSAMIGGTQRARVSSQCWKRAIRMTLGNPKNGIAVRTRLADKLIQEECEKLGATPEQAKFCGKLTFWAMNHGTGTSRNSELKKQAEKMKKSINEEESSEKDPEKIPTAFLSVSEAREIAKFFLDYKFELPKEDNKKEDKKGDKKDKTNQFYGNLFKKLEEIHPNTSDGLDIALFGRMAASLPEMNVEAAASFAHAISTHRSVSEVEFFTAVDDLDKKGTAHMGTLEFNSATYYRYISLDLGQLLTNLGEDANFNLTPAIEAFTKALYIAVPTARQSTMAAGKIWDYARVLIRKGHRIQVSFEDAVKPQKGESILAASKAKLKEQLNFIEKISGSLYGKIASFEFGETDFSIDKLIAALCDKVREIQAE
ncbi:MAG: type I-E CRISPR-associated protein Cas7/Cse4/CasC [Thermoguttaceae bacterium]|nr:type I-E CRISPR-associated protein Cas7/Cse4/CasC [Thermoguttaceae bacterium]